jgi:membrane-bound lytic murein transglycosylase D
MTSQKPFLLLLCTTFLTVAMAHESLAEARDEIFPIAPELRRDVDFWRDVFTEYGSDEGVLHDNRNLSIVYERFAMPENLGRRERQRRVSKRRKSLQSVLRKLASGARTDLSDEETRVLALWPTDVSNSSLKTAAARIRYQQGLKERFQRGLQRSGRWRAHVNKEFKALGVPIEMAALPHVESSYNPDARSHVGASGIWQFTRSTGRRFLRVDHVVDERNDPFAATRAAGQLLAYNYSITGNWPMAITAYNHGLGGVRRAMRQYGDTAYVDILRKYKGRSFGFASRNFYVAFLAAKEVDQNVEKYFPGLQAEQPAQYDVLNLPAFVPVDEMTKALGVTARRLKSHNPALQATVWQGSKHLPKGFQLRLPTGSAARSLASVMQTLPADVVFARQLPDLFHSIVRGDTLSQIATTYRTRVSTLKALNNLSSSHRIRAGQQLRLPAAGPAPQQPAPVTTAAVVPEEVVGRVSEPQVAVSESAPPEVDAEPATAVLTSVQTELLSDPSDYSVAADGTIEVHPLETLGHFGDWLEIKTQRLRNLNGFAFRTQVAVGQRIRLDLHTVDAKAFEERRIAYHRAQQDEFFRQHVIRGAKTHTIRSGESIWVVALRQYNVPLWLFRQYNPGINLHKVHPGTTVQIPLLSDKEQRS